MMHCIISSWLRALVNSFQTRIFKDTVVSLKVAGIIVEASWSLQSLLWYWERATKRGGISIHVPSGTVWLATIGGG